MYITCVKLASSFSGFVFFNKTHNKKIFSECRSVLGIIGGVTRFRWELNPYI
ncbi:unnamed protein product [Staurois parvus]|uniref:Uncharacterized protein n=1 Tax=Staurois parvus TaxID=386267 RepID=A0ABN9EQK8_9NEOB|nr:unnamed protein product [Staurois parvus]